MTFSKYYGTVRPSGSTTVREAIEATAERGRLAEPGLIHTWRHWGPYVSDRQWGTVRESYDAKKSPWNDFTHAQARSRAYRWGEDGLFGICDLQQLLCFSLALWNERDPILKDRLFGLTGPQGNHGEDVKEYYYYLDNVPTHSYMKGLYKYPYRYPYEDLYQKRLEIEPLEYELMDTGVFGEGYFDVQIEYAKSAPEDILVRITVTNRGPDTRTLHVLPTLWYRNTWSWAQSAPPKPQLSVGRSTGPSGAYRTVAASEVKGVNQEVLLAGRCLYCQGGPELLFTDNESNYAALGWGANDLPYKKDGIDDYVVSGAKVVTVNPACTGTKAAAHYRLRLGPGQSDSVVLRLCPPRDDPFSEEFEETFATRRAEADEFYDAICPYRRTGDAAEQDLYRVQRQAFAGMLWSKQFYYLITNRWLLGDDRQPKPSPEHSGDAKMDAWVHMYCKDVISMPDKWEYPWFAAWDLAFHTTTLAFIDPAFAKFQLELLLMEWYQHPNAQLPAYEWDFSNVNPPVHAWAAWKVYRAEVEIYGKGDVAFLDRVFSKLNMNFIWWVNKVDARARNVFHGGFLGLDNIRIVDKDPSGKPLEQADGTAWMSLFCLNMLRIALELEAVRGGAIEESYVYRDAARKYLQHFMYMGAAMNAVADEGLWDATQGFFMDCANEYGRLNVFSLVGLVPLFAIEQIGHRVSTSNPESFYDLYGFVKWFAKNRPDLWRENDYISNDLLDAVSAPTVPQALIGTLAVIDKQNDVPTGTPSAGEPRPSLRLVLRRMLNPDEFLSSRGIRGLSRWHLDHRTFYKNGDELRIKYEPAESIEMKAMGGNSNWCGPIWMPLNYLIVESLRKYHRYMGPDYRVEYPTGSSQQRSLEEVADDLSKRLVSIFLRDPLTQRRPVFGDDASSLFQSDPAWKDCILFYEYFHGGNAFDRYAGAGLGASHQTGWTGLVANLIQEMGVRERARSSGIAEDSELPPGIG